MPCISHKDIASGSTDAHRSDVLFSTYCFLVKLTAKGGSDKRKTDLSYDITYRLIFPFIFLFFIFYFFTPLVLIAQNPRDFYPFHVGDLWQYEDNDGSVFNKTLIADSVDSAGSHYLTYENEYIKSPMYPSWVGYKWQEKWMIDTLNHVYQFDKSYIYNDGKALLYDLNKNYGEWYVARILSQDSVVRSVEAVIVMDTAYVVLFDTTSFLKFYESYGSPTSDGNPDSFRLQFGYHVLASGFGMIYLNVEFYSESLNGAVINGITYGDIIVSITDKSGVPKTDKKGIIKTYPNPFNNRITISYFSEQTEPIEISVYNVLGQAIKSLVKEVQAAGAYTITWDGRDNLGKSVPSGMYVIVLKNTSTITTNKVLFLK